MICIIIAYAYVMLIMKKVKNIKILVAYNAIVMILLKIGYFMISYRIGFNRNSLDELIYGDKIGDAANFAVILAVIIILMLLNQWSLIDYWLDSRKSEIHARSLCGADVKSLMALMSGYYTAVFIESIAISEVLGIIFYILFKKCTNYLVISPLFYVGAIAILFLIAQFMIIIQLNLRLSKRRRVKGY